MINDLIALFEQNNVKVFLEYPQENVPSEFMLMENMGSSNENLSVITNKYKISLYSKNDINVFQTKISKLLLKETQNFNYCGHPVLESSKEIEYDEEYKKVIMTFMLDKIKYI